MRHPNFFISVKHEIKYCKPFLWPEKIEKKSRSYFFQKQKRLIALIVLFFMEIEAIFKKPEGILDDVNFGEWGNSDFSSTFCCFSSNRRQFRVVVKSRDET